MTASAEARDTALLAAQAAADKLATDVSIVDVSDRLAITDAFVLASAPNERQVQSIVDEVEERLREHGIKPVRREGVAESRWVLLDFVDVVVHVQHAEERAYYALERLWKDCPTIPFVDRAAPAPRRPTAAGRDDGTGARSRTRRPLPTGDDRPVTSALPVLPVPRLVLWRHGRTEWNATGRFQGQLDPPLDEVGPRPGRRSPRRTWSPPGCRRDETRRGLQRPAAAPPRPPPRSPTCSACRCGSTPGCASTAWAAGRGSPATRSPSGTPTSRRLDGRPAGARPRRGGARRRSPSGRVAALADLPPARVAVVVTHGGTAGRLMERLLGLGPDHRRAVRAAGQLRVERARPSRARAGGCSGTTARCCSCPPRLPRAQPARCGPCPARRRRGARGRRRAVTDADAVH